MNDLQARYSGQITIVRFAGVEEVSNQGRKMDCWYEPSFVYKIIRG